jgi:uncharacterized protein YjbJ (UPF0337 family)
MPAASRPRNLLRHAAPAWRANHHGVASMAISKLQLKGRVRQVKGGLERAAGKLTGSRKLQLKGSVDGAVGSVQVAAGKAKTKATAQANRAAKKTARAGRSGVAAAKKAAKRALRG